ncbi:hypothetical protein ACFLRP_03105 [Bacteroidota bacterium]
MLIDLNNRDIVNNFNNALRNMNFVSPADYAEIKTNLDMLADLTQRGGKSIKFGRVAKTRAAEWLWVYFFGHSFKHISANTRGYQKIIDYYKDYIHYENLLFALDENHRDHVIHSIWVMLIGFYLLIKCHPIRHISFDAYFFNSTNETQIEGIKRTKEIIKTEYQPALWILISLTHDLGYPIQKTLMANVEMSQMIAHFGFLQQTSFTYQFTIVHQTAIEELLNNISTALIWDQNDTYRLGIYPGRRLDYSKSFEGLDHGIMSAYLLQKYLDYICEIFNYPRNIPDLVYRKIEYAAKQVAVISWLDSIASHTNNNRFWSNINNFCSLLLISDELDEFSRYARKKNSDQWTNVKCETKFNYRNKSINIVFRFHRPVHFDSLPFFKGKVKKLMNRFNLAKDEIRKLSITCIDDRSGNKEKYYYERHFDSDSLGFVKRLHGGTTSDIHGFLKDKITI